MASFGELVNVKGSGGQKLTDEPLTPVTLRIKLMRLVKPLSGLTQVRSACSIRISFPVAMPDVLSQKTLVLPACSSALNRNICIRLRPVLTADVDDAITTRPVKIKNCFSHSSAAQCDVAAISVKHAAVNPIGAGRKINYLVRRTAGHCTLQNGSAISHSGIIGAAVSDEILIDRCANGNATGHTHITLPRGQPVGWHNLCENGSCKERGRQKREENAGMHEAPFLFAFVEFVNSMAFCASELPHTVQLH